MDNYLREVIIIYGGVLVHRFDKPTYIWIHIYDILVRFNPIYFFHNVQPQRYFEYMEAEANLFLSQNTDSELL